CARTARRLPRRRDRGDHDRARPQRRADGRACPGWPCRRDSAAHRRRQEQVRGGDASHHGRGAPSLLYEAAPMKKILTSTCYLCAKPLTPPTNADHPVMQQLFAPEIRRKYNISQLLTLDVHKACNTAYKRDEDYFVRTLMPFAQGSEAGNAIYQKVRDDYRAGKEALLTRKVLREFDPQPHGLVLPGGKVVKRFEGERLRRVVWKMVRGLHFHHSGGEVLPERWSSV